MPDHLEQVRNNNPQKNLAELQLVRSALEISQAEVQSIQSLLMTLLSFEEKNRVGKEVVQEDFERGLNAQEVSVSFPGEAEEDSAENMDQTVGEGIAEKGIAEEDMNQAVGGNIAEKDIHQTVGDYIFEDLHQAVGDYTAEDLHQTVGHYIAGDLHQTVEDYIAEDLYQTVGDLRVEPNS